MMGLMIGIFGTAMLVLEKPSGFSFQLLASLVLFDNKDRELYFFMQGFNAILFNFVNDLYTLDLQQKPLITGDITDSNINRA